MQHTPGPWKVNKYGSIGAGENGHDPTVATVEPFYGEDKKYGDHPANARLIAAPTALLERLQAIIDWCDLALANKDEFHKHGVKNLDGPVFDEARARHPRGDGGIAMTKLLPPGDNDSQQRFSEDGHKHARAC